MCGFQVVHKTEAEALLSASNWIRNIFSGGRYALPHLSIIHSVKSLLELFRHNNLPLDRLLQLREDEANLRDNFLQALDLLKVEVTETSKHVAQTAWISAQIAGTIFLSDNTANTPTQPTPTPTPPEPQNTTNNNASINNNDKTNGHLEEKNVQWHSEPPELLQLCLVVVLYVVLWQTLQQLGGLLENNVLATSPTASSPTLRTGQDTWKVRVRSVECSVTVLSVQVCCMR